jgi:GNAT superfamily N-acetyltransferase
MEKIIRIDEGNIDDEHICCAIGSDKANRARAESKKAWLRERFAEGLVFKRLDERGKVFVEYLPAEAAWKPVEAPGYLLINCLWVSGRFKGGGWSRALLEECIADARRQGKAGLVYVAAHSREHYLTDARFFLHHGFEAVDTAPPYFQLLALHFDPAAPTPAFTGAAVTGTCAQQEGFSFIYSNQCPFMEEYVGLLADIARSRGYKAAVRRLESAEEARRIGSPFGTLGIWFNGHLRAHAPMTEKSFTKFLAELE